MNKKKIDEFLKEAYYYAGIGYYVLGLICFMWASHFANTDDEPIKFVVAALLGVGLLYVGIIIRTSEEP